MSASNEVGAHTTGDFPQDREEFQTIAQSIQGVQDPEILFPTSTRTGELLTEGREENNNEDGESAKDQEEEKAIDSEASHYWDASTMKPLSPASAVSTYTSFFDSVSVVCPRGGSLGSGAVCPASHSDSGPGLHGAPRWKSGRPLT